MGVPPFQEQAMKLAMVGASMAVWSTPDRLCRDMVAFRRNGQIEEKPQTQVHRRHDRQWL
jgi:DNA polymerase III alpha subunit